MKVKEKRRQAGRGWVDVQGRPAESHTADCAGHESTQSPWSWTCCPAYAAAAQRAAKRERERERKERREKKREKEREIEIKTGQKGVTKVQENQRTCPNDSLGWSEWSRCGHVACCWISRAIRAHGPLGWVWKRRFIHYPQKNPSSNDGKQNKKNKKTKLA